DVWIYTPFVAILVLAGIRSLPKEPFEASAVDGASWFYMFRRLMLPMMWPYILVAVIFRFMDSLKIFDHVFVLTAGGPGDATRTLQIGAYQNSIIQLQYSRGSTYMFLHWVIVFLTARYLVSVLGKAQRRAAGSEEEMAARELGPGQRRFSPASIGADLVLLAWFVFSLFPLVWMVLLALKTDAEQISTYFAFTPTLENFATVLSSEGERLTSVDFTDAL